jgi:hypothetical protein
MATTSDKGKAVTNVIMASLQGLTFSTSTSAMPFKFNVHALEFMPMSHAIASLMLVLAEDYYSPFMWM